MHGEDRDGIVSSDEQRFVVGHTQESGDGFQKRNDGIPVHACENCAYFDNVICAITLDKNVLYFDHDQSCRNESFDKARTCFLEAKENLNIKARANALSVVLNDAFALAMDEIKNLVEIEEAKKRQEVEEFRKRMRETLEGRMRLALEDTGARLIDHMVRGNLAEIRWRSRRNRTYNSVIDINNMNVVTAGICLSGTDRVFDLTSLIGVVHEGERRSLIVVTRP